MKRKTLLFVLVVAGLFAIAACGSDTEAENDNEADNNGASNNNGDSNKDSYVIGTTQILEHPSLDQATEGFEDAIEEAGLDVEFDYQNAQNDQNNVKTIADNFVADDVDLIFANSTPSALGALNATDDIPILFTSVTDAVEAELVDSMEEPGSNATGVVDLHPDAIKETVKFMDENFEDANVGLIYSAGEKNSVTQIEAVQDAMEGTSLSAEEKTVSNSSEVQQAADSLAGSVDLFYIITDNTVVSALDAVVGVSEEQQIPLVVGEPDSLEGGGFATYGIDYYTIGYRTGEMAVEVLEEGKDPASMEVEYPEDMQLIINKEAADAQGVEWKDDWDEAAERFETE